MMENGKPLSVKQGSSMILFLCVNMYSLSAYSVPVTVIDIGDATVNIKDIWYIYHIYVV